MSGMRWGTLRQIDQCSSTFYPIYVWRQLLTVVIPLSTRLGYGISP